MVHDADTWSSSKAPV